MLYRMPRTPSSTPPRSPGTPISDRSLSPPPLNSQQPAISSPSTIQNGIAPRKVRQTPTPPLSPHRAASPRRTVSPRRAQSPRRTQSPRRHPPDPNLVDTSRPPPMRQQPVPQQVTHFLVLHKSASTYQDPKYKQMHQRLIHEGCTCICNSSYLTIPLSASGSSAARSVPPSPRPPPTLLPPATHQPCRRSSRRI